MRRLALLLPILALAGALAPSAALGKGPIEAKIDGPGLGSPLRFGGWENWGEEDALAPHQPVMQLAEAAGFFPAAFGQEPSPMLARKPAGPLGPRYVVEYGVPGPNNDRFRIVQDVYPYAKPDPVTYMPPGQPLFETDGTRGGWFAATNPSVPPLLFILTNAGLPKGPPAAGDDSSFPWTLVAVLPAAAGLLALGLGGTVLLRRRLGPAADF